MKPLFTLISILLLSNPAICQYKLQRQVIGSTGGSLTSSSGIRMEVTIGESITQTISSISGTLHLLQGFQQPFDKQGTVGRPDLLDLVVDYKIYPNPSAKELFIELESEKRVQLSVKFSDMRGREVAIPSHTFQGSGFMRKQFSLASLSEGTYMLTFTDQNDRVLQTHKIQKY